MEKILHLHDKEIRYYEYLSKDIQNSTDIKNYLICCPGWLCSPTTMGDIISEVANFTNYTLIVLEWRGHGNSKVFFCDNVTISLLADDLRSLVVYLKSSTTCVSLLGHSMGVNVIWRYIEKFGEAEIDRYIFLDQPAAITGSIAGERMGYKKEWRIHSKAEVYFLAFLCVLKNYLIIPILQKAFSVPWMRGRFLEYAKKCNSVACARLLIDTTFTDNTRRVSLVSRPCLIYGGEASFVNPDVQRWIAQRVRGPVRLLIYPKPYGTHFPFYPVESDALKYGPSRLVRDISDYLLSDQTSLKS